MMYLPVAQVIVLSLPLLTLAVPVLVVNSHLDSHLEVDIGQHPLYSRYVN